MQGVASPWRAGCDGAYGVGDGWEKCWPSGLNDMGVLGGEAGEGSDESSCVDMSDSASWVGVRGVSSGRWGLWRLDVGVVVGVGGARGGCAAAVAALTCAWWAATKWCASGLSGPSVARVSSSRSPPGRHVWWMHLPPLGRSAVRQMEGVWCWMDS